MRHSSIYVQRHPSTHAREPSSGLLHLVELTSLQPPIQSLSMSIMSSSSTPQSGVGLRRFDCAVVCRGGSLPSAPPRSRPRKLGGMCVDREEPRVFPVPQTFSLGCDCADGFSFSFPFAPGGDVTGRPVRVLPEPEKEG